MIQREKLKGKGLQNHINYLKTFKEDFTVEYKGSIVNIYTENELFKYMSGYIDKSAFCAYNMLKKDIKISDKLGEILQHKPEKNMWYSNSSFIQEGEFDYLYHIDLSSAYTRSLFNEKIISQKSFEFCENIAKINRLISLGLFAKRTDIYTYELGKVVNYESEKSDLRNVFFYSAFQVDLIMNELKDVLGDCYVFFWFDGIYYFLKNRQENDAKKYLLMNNLPYHNEILTECTIYKLFPMIEFCFRKSGKPYRFFLKDKHAENLFDIEVKKELII